MTDGIDARIPRAKAAFHTLVPAIGFAFGRVEPVAFTAIAMVVSVLGGPRLSLFGRLYTQIIKPGLQISEGPREHPAPHRFAEALGAIFISAATVLLLVGAETAGWGLALAVVALAALNWLGGICVGCKIYPLIGGRRRRAPAGG